MAASAPPAPPPAQMELNQSEGDGRAQGSCVLPGSAPPTPPRLPRPVLLTLPTGASARALTSHVHVWALPLPTARLLCPQFDFLRKRACCFLETQKWDPTRLGCTLSLVKPPPHHLGPSRLREKTLLLIFSCVASNSPVIPILWVEIGTVTSGCLLHSEASSALDPSSSRRQCGLFPAQSPRGCPLLPWLRALRGCLLPTLGPAASQPATPGRTRNAPVCSPANGEAEYLATAR